MGFFITSPVPKKCGLSMGNRVWGLFGDGREFRIINWPSRDPIGERGGVNLYGMVENSAVGRVDVLGLTAQGQVTEYHGKETTSSCACPIKVKFDKAQWVWRSNATSSLGVQMDVNMTFSLESKASECNCLKVRGIQISGRFKKNGDPASADGNRGDRTTTENSGIPGWRVDWPDNLGGTAVPFLDNVGKHISEPWTPGNSGTVKDPPAIENSGETFKVYTCFIGVKAGGEHKFLGCLHWGFTMTKKGRRISGATTRKFREPEFNVLSGTPSWSCSMPKEVGAAIKRWNYQYSSNSKVHIPNISEIEKNDD